MWWQQTVQIKNVSLVIGLKGLYISGQQLLVHFYPSDDPVAISQHIDSSMPIDHFVAAPAPYSANPVHRLKPQGPVQD